LPTLYKHDDDTFQFYENYDNLLKIVENPYYEFSHDQFYDLDKQLHNWDSFTYYFYRLVKLVKELEHDVILSNSTHIQNNCHPEELVPHYSYPSGETCKAAFNFLLQSFSCFESFLVAEDNGTKTLLPPVYYALWKSNKLFKKDNGLVSNYIATSSLYTSRARLSFDLLNCFLSADIIITPCSPDSEYRDKLIKHCKKFAKIGFIIYSKINDEKLLSLSSKVVLVSNTDYVFYFIPIAPLKIPRVSFVVPNKKAHRQETLSFLIQSST
jgi:hypothetical protein